MTKFVIVIVDQDIHGMNVKVKYTVNVKKILFISCLNEDPDGKAALTIQAGDKTATLELDSEAHIKLKKDLKSLLSDNYLDQ